LKAGSRFRFYQASTIRQRSTRLPRPTRPFPCGKAKTRRRLNGLPGVIVDGPEGPVQTAAFEIEGDVVRALYVVRNPDKLRHLAAVPPPHESGRG
jgi:hypothetical protein